MVIRNDEPEIAVAIGGDDLSSLPVATAVPATVFSDPNKNIERTTNADGSLMVKVTTTVHQPNGYREVTIEYFQVPASLADTVIMSMDATGEPPSSLYMTKTEQQVLPPGTSAVTSHAPTPVASVPVASAPVASTTAAVVVTNPGNAGRNPTTEPSNSDSKRTKIISFIFIAVIITLINVTRSVRRRNNSKDKTTVTISNPMCEDTPGWVDSDGEGCDFYENENLSYLDKCSAYGNVFVGLMGSALDNCCICGGGSTLLSTDPAIDLLPKPAVPPDCVDTPDWVDVDGSGCETYEFLSNFCEIAYTWEGDMGAADANCCVCGGGTIVSNSSSSIAPTPTYSSTAVPTIMSEDEVMGVNATEMGMNATNGSDESI